LIFTVSKDDTTSKEHQKECDAPKSALNLMLKLNFKEKKLDTYSDGIELTSLETTLSADQDNFVQVNKYEI
jgi:hypothetical protein